MKTKRLFSLELERNSLQPYQIAVVVSNFFYIGIYIFNGNNSKN